MVKDCIGKFIKFGDLPYLSFHVGKPFTTLIHFLVRWNSSHGAALSDLFFIFILFFINSNIYLQIKNKTTI